MNEHNAWRQLLRNILRNTSVFKIREWCREAGISSIGERTLIAYANGTSITELAVAYGKEERTMSRIRLRSLKQLRSYLVAQPDECPIFAETLESVSFPKDDGPMPRKCVQNVLLN